MDLPERGDIVFVAAAAAVVIIVVDGVRRARHRPPPGAFIPGPRLPGRGAGRG